VLLDPGWSDLVGHDQLFQTVPKVCLLGGVEKKGEKEDCWYCHGVVFVGLCCGSSLPADF
jgi:hypothetical protein